MFFTYSIVLLALPTSIVNVAPTAVATGPALVNLGTASNYAILAQSGGRSKLAWVCGSWVAGRGSLGKTSVALLTGATMNGKVLAQTTVTLQKATIAT
ncbi:hypothetical protein C8J56DRAFT_1057190 [Mycena floridula]|nr:hypothetical protein C8J56DRAFT_1057190 [Mycena floridula]